MVSACTPIGTTPPSNTPTASSAATPSASPAPPRTVISAYPPDDPHGTKVVVDDPSTVLRQPDNEPYSPDAFAVVGDTVTLDDPVNGTLNVYRGGKKVEQLTEPDTCCNDLLIDTENHYWTLSDNKAWEYLRKPGAKKLTHIATYPAGNDQPTALFQDGPNILSQQVMDEVILVHGPGPVGPFLTMKVHKKSVTADDGEGFNVEIETRYAADDIEMLTRTANYYYLQVTDAGGMKWGTVYQFSRAGILTNTYTLESPIDKTPLRSVQVAPDGQVYEMVISNKTTRIYRIPPNNPPVK